MKITQAQTEAEFAEARRLFQEYADWLGEDLSYQQFDEELRTVDQIYVPTQGRLLLAWDEGEAVGCVGLRDLGAGTCEMKRLYVQPTHQGRGHGRQLAEVVVDKARSIGYTRMVLDTLSRLKAARALYRSMGFAEIEPYYFNPLPGVIYMALTL